MSSGNLTFNCMAFKKSSNSTFKELGPWIIPSPWQWWKAWSKSKKRPTFSLKKTENFVKHMKITKINLWNPKNLTIKNFHIMNKSIKQKRRNQPEQSQTWNINFNLPNKRLKNVNPNLEIISIKSTKWFIKLSNN